MPSDVTVTDFLEAGSPAMFFFWYPTGQQACAGGICPFFSQQGVRTTARLIALHPRHRGDSDLSCVGWRWLQSYLPSSRPSSKGVLSAV